MVRFETFDAASCPRAVFHFRYKVYVEEMRRPQIYADHAQRTIIDPLDATAHHAVAFDGDEVVGCVRGNYASDDIGIYKDLFDIRNLDDARRRTMTIGTRLMVARKHRKTTTPLNLFTNFFRFGLSHGVEVNYLDCNAPLKRLFIHLGYRHMFDKMHPEYGRVSIMRLDMLDIAHLDAVGSPFADFARKTAGPRPDDPPRRANFGR